MVPTRETKEAMALEYNALLPLNKAAVGTFLKDVLPGAVPSINLVDLDPNERPQAYGPYGKLIEIGIGSATLTSVGPQSHVYLMQTAGIPANEVHVYKEMVVSSNVAAVWYCVMTGALVGAWTQRIWEGNSGGAGRVIVPVIAADIVAGATELNRYGQEIIVPPTCVLQLATDNITGVTTLNFVRYRYRTPLTPADVSATIDAATV